VRIGVVSANRGVDATRQKDVSALRKVGDEIVVSHPGGRAAASVHFGPKVPLPALRERSRNSK